MMKDCYRGLGLNDLLGDPLDNLILDGLSLISGSR